MTIRRAVLALAAALSATTLVGGLPSAAAQPTATRRTAELILVSQTSWVAAGGEFVMRLRPPATLATGAASDLELSVAVHPAIGTRSAFQRSLTERPTTSPLAVIANPVTSLPVDENGAVEVRVGVQDPAAPRDPTRVGLRNGGVYPVVAELRPAGGGAVEGRLVTHLLFVPAPPDGPRLGVTLVLPIARPPGLQPDGTVRFADNAAASFTALSAAISAAPGGLVLDPTPETLAALARSQNPDERAALGALRAAVANRPVVGTEPFVPVARAAYTGVAGLEALRTLLERGRAVTEEAFDSPTDAGVTVLTAGIDESHLPEVGTGSRLIVPERLLNPVEQRVTLANAVALRRGPARSAGTLPALVADAALGAHFGPDRRPVLGAHQLLADLATIYFDSPGRRRAVVVMPPRSAIIRPALLTQLLAGIASSPVLGLVDLDEQFAITSSGPGAAGRPPVRTLAPPGPVGLPADLPAVRAEISSLLLTLADQPDLVTSFSDRLLIAQSSDLRGRARTTSLDRLARAVDVERRKFRLPRQAAVRLTARTGRIPITVNSRADYPARVLLEVASDKLRFPGGATRMLMLTHRNTTAQIRTTSQGSGTFPLRVMLKTPDGKLVLAESRFTVQSTAASGVGVFLSIGALLVLAGWWVRHNRRYRPRAGRQRAETTNTGDDAP